MEKYIKWDTLFSELDELFIETILDDVELCITVGNGNLNAERKIYKVTFSDYVIYHVTLEEYTTQVPPSLRGKQGELGHARIIEGSEWLKALSEKEPLILIHSRNPSQLKHYEIAGWNKVISIISDVEPKIEQQGLI